MSAEGTPSQPPRRRRWPLAVTIVVVLVGALVGVFFLVDGFARGAAERLVADQFASRFGGEDGGVTNDDVDVRIGGTSVIVQYLSGRFDRVEVEASDVLLDGIPADLRLLANGVPTDLDQPVAAAEGRVSFGQAGLDVLVARSGANATVVLGDGAVSYVVAREVFGIPLSLTVSAVPEAAGDSILFRPTDATVEAGGASLDVSGIVDAVIADSGISVCVADRLPAGVEITHIDVTPAALVVRFAAQDLAISALATKGSCSV